MPHKFYHGRTGRVWNVTKRSIGVEVNKQVGNRIIRKRIHFGVEHVQPSRCHEEILQRIKRNDKLKAAKVQGKIISTKRQPEGPKPGFMVEGTTIETVTPLKPSLRYHMMWSTISRVVIKWVDCSVHSAFYLFAICCVVIRLVPAFRLFLCNDSDQINFWQNDMIYATF
ncbi:60S ribosomal protein l21-1 [Phtheirospermum japonicum]|uniref:60S ribosomal protein l21-1 n=1 Tax=Phtheirospermum japonicum TaxID=374723 RepID=A0A830B3G5_9LAMI|nr:60S ribosomal protein l21-1 [Phtheirospermum japonicum]